MTTALERTSAIGPANRILDTARLREDFPALDQEVHGHRLVYLDNAASSQKPLQVIDAIADYYRHDHSNVHRGVHTLSERATAAYEGAREKVRRFINAAGTREVIYVRGTTEGINLVAASYGTANVRAGDEVLITGLEHHSNIVPWQLLCDRTGATLRVVPVLDDGSLDLDAYQRLLGERTRIVAFGHVSNALGTINPVREMTRMAHDAGAVVVVDGAQAAPHTPIDVRALECDFYAFSPHKAYGPTGIGVLWGREALLEAMPPWQGGGEMIRTVSFEGSTWAELPHKFEAGTPHIAGAVGLGASLDYLEGIGLEAIERHEHDVLAYATAIAEGIPGLRILGTASPKAGILSFVLDGIHPHDIGTMLDHQGIAIRTGHHCAMPLMKRLGVPATARASLGLYNDRDDIDALFTAVARVQEAFA